LRESLANKEHSFEEQEVQLNTVIGELKIRNDELLLIKSSRTYRLIYCISNDSFGPKKIYNITRIIVAMAVPEKVKSIIKDISFKLKKKITEPLC